MSLDFIYTFKLKILAALETLLETHVKKIYISVAQDGNYPFILINFIKVDNYSSPIQAIYLLEFEICIFSREQNKKILLNISDLISNLLSVDTLKIPRYTIAGLKLNDLFFDEARDLIHSPYASA